MKIYICNYVQPTICGINALGKAVKPQTIGGEPAETDFLGFSQPVAVLEALWKPS